MAVLERRQYSQASDATDCVGASIIAIRLRVTIGQ